MNRIARADVVGVLLLAVAGVLAAKWTSSAAAPGAATLVPAAARNLPRLVDVGADKGAGTSIHSVNRRVGWRVGERAVVAVRAVAGVGVMLGGAYFVWTAM